MAKLLRLKRLKGVHFVDSGAAINAGVLVIKRKKGAEMLDKEKLLKVLSAALDSAMQDESTPAEAEKAEDIKEPMAEPAKAEMKEGEETPDEVTIDEAPVQEDVKAEQLLEAALDGLDDERKALILEAFNAVNPVEKSDEEMKEPAEVEKADTEEPEEVVKARKETEEVKAKLAEAEELIQKRKDKDELDEQIAIAKRFESVPGDIKERGQLLLSVKKSIGEKAHQKLVSDFEQMEKISKGLLDTPGTAAIDFENSSDSAMGQMEREVANFMKAEKATESKAWTEVAKRNPKLYAKVERERQLAFRIQ